MSSIAVISQPFDYVGPRVQGSSVGIWTAQVAGRLARLGHGFTVYSKHFSDQPLNEAQAGIEYRRVSTRLDEWIAKPLRIAESMFGFPFKHSPFFSTGLNYPGYAAFIGRELSRQKVEIIHIHNFSQFVPVFRRAAPDARIVLHMHCEWLTQLSQPMIERRLADADLVVSCSDYITAKTRTRFPAHAHKCVTVPNGVDARQFARPAKTPQPDNGSKRLLFVGRVSPEKGLHVLLEAFELVLEQVPTARLDIVGAAGNVPYEYMVLISSDPGVQQLGRFYHGRRRRGDYFTELQSGLPAHLQDRVRFTGGVDYAGIAAFYRQADILINPSLSEAFGMSLVEAMAAGIPVVATRVGGMTEIVENGACGVLVPPDRPAELASVILSLLTDDKNRAEIGRRGAQRVGTCFDWTHVAGRLNEAYERILQPAWNR